MLGDEEAGIMEEALPRKLNRADWSAKRKSSTVSSRACFRSLSLRSRHGSVVAGRGTSSSLTQSWGGSALLGHSCRPAGLFRSPAPSSLGQRGRQRRRPQGLYWRASQSLAGRCSRTALHRDPAARRLSLHRPALISHCSSSYPVITQQQALSLCHPVCSALISHPSSGARENSTSCNGPSLRAAPRGAPASCLCRASQG